MAKLIGTVTHVTGEVFAVDANGGRRALVDGDKLFAGEQLQTGALGAVAVHLADGGELTLGRDSSMPLTNEILANHATHVETGDTKGPTADQQADIAQIQKAIVAGDDPTKTGEATAAGPATVGGPPGPLGGGHSFVLLSEVGGHVDPVLGFPTAGFGFTPIVAGYEAIAPATDNNGNGNANNGGSTPTPPVVTPTDDSINLDLGSGALDVNEANLPLGSAPNMGALTQTGSFTINAPDGMKSLSVGGISVIADGAASGFPQSITTSLGNTLTVTGYNSQTGVVTYTYTLNVTETDAPGNGANNVVDHLTVVATNNDGNTASGTLNVTITDDVPKAVDDTNPHIATDTLPILTGNVLTNDIQGADRIPSGPIVGGTFVGTYGTLVLAADGTYTYTLNPHDPGFTALRDGGSGSDVFTYTLKDADGDTSQATLTLQVHNNPVLIGGLSGDGNDVIVYEKNLEVGSAPNAGALTQHGTFTVTANDGLQTLSIGGVNVITGGVASGFPQAITTGYGNTLTITGFNAETGVVSYTYTLNGAHTDNPGIAGANTDVESIKVVATDTDGSTATGTLHAGVVDDVPTANNDTNASTATDTVPILTGNVLTNDIQGADRVAGGPVVGGTFSGTYGTLVLAADGTYTYTLNPHDPGFTALRDGGSGTDVFTYTIKDADGDTSQATLTLQVQNNPVLIGGLNGDGNDVTVFEKNLTLGSAPDSGALTQHGTFTVTAADGLQTLSIGGLSVIVGGVASGFPESITTGLGNTLTITGYNALTGVISYTYTLNGAHTDNPGIAGANTDVESFKVVATDADGSTATGTLHAGVVDDVPTANNDSNRYTASESHLTLSGNVLTNDVQGADRVTGGPIVAGTFVGKYGTLVLAADGTYTYTLNSHDPDFVALHGGGNGTEVFTYTLTDADGDTSTAKLVLNVHNNNDPVTIDCLDVRGGEVTVYEKNLSNGSSPNAGALTKDGTFVIHAPDGLQTLTINGVTVDLAKAEAGQAQLFTSALGNVLSITGYNAQTGVVSYSYTLEHPAQQPDGQGANSIAEHFTVVATDSDGSHASGILDVNIVDDVPTAHPDTAYVTEGGTVTGNVLYNDVGGADGPGTTGGVIGVRAGGDTSHDVITGVNATIVGLYGTLVLDAYGNGTYHANPNSVHAPGAEDIFTYSIRDADGDISTTTIKIIVTDSGLKACNSDGVTVFENALDLTQTGHDLAPGTVIGSNPDSPLETGSSSLAGSVSGGSGALTYSLVGSTNGTLVGEFGVIHLNSDGSYTYTLTSAPKTNGGNDGANVTNESFTYKVTDALGNTVTAQIVVNIVDDVPKAACIDRSVAAAHLDSNLLLVIDVSGSMNDPSGVGGLSRLDLAKQAINDLLNKYEAMGDVKVQVVVFNNGSETPSNVWVDIATAKAYIAGLHADGGTNYDYALNAAATAFDTAGKIVGAQNVAYFFSDGNPTLSSANPDPSHNNPNQTNPALGDGIDSTEEAAWINFLNTNHINSYAIGLGDGVSNTYLNPIAYNGATGTNTNGVVVNDLNGLNAVLTGTVPGASIVGSLLAGGSFGADGGFIKAVIVDGISYVYDPKANGGQGGGAVYGGASHGTFDTSTNSLTVITHTGGTLVVDMDNGEYTYTAPKGSTGGVTETFGYVLSDNDGDLAGSTLVVNVTGNLPPVAVDDHVITNILAPTITVPAELLLANDTDPNGDKLTASPTTFNTGWATKGADFTATCVKTIAFNGHANIDANQMKTLDRSDFFSNSTALTALVVLNGYLGANASTANAQDLYTVTLHKGETVTLDEHHQGNGNIALQWQDTSGAVYNIADGGTFTATSDGVYHIHLTNQTANSAHFSGDYQLNVAINYAAADPVTPDAHATYTANDGHGGTSTANVDITYQGGDTLQGTQGDDILIAGPGNVHIHGGDGNDVLQASASTLEMFGDNGNDLMYASSGNELIDGGLGVNTVSFAHATAGVHVNLEIIVAQDTIGAGHDTFANIQNLIGSPFNDVLIGGTDNNVINGGGGNNILTGGGGYDTFQWSSGSTGHDVVTDFNPSTDKLDLSQLLQGDGANASSLDDYLHFKVTGTGASVVTSIEVGAAGAPASQTIDLQGVNLASHFGVSPGQGGLVASGHDTATIVNGMLGEHSLKVDTV